MLYRKCKQVYVGDLPWAMNSARIHDSRIQQTDCIRPELMNILTAGLGQMLDDSLDRQRVWIARVRHDADAPILRDWT